MGERDSEWYSGGDPDGSSGDILSSGDTAVTNSGGGLMVGTRGMCNGCTEMAGSNSSLSSGTGGVQWTRNNSASWGSAGRGDVAVADAQWDAVGDGSNGSSSANGSGSGNGSTNAEGESEMPMTPEPDHGRESARAARARARAAVAERHKAELKEFVGLDQ